MTVEGTVLKKVEVSLPGLQQEINFVESWQRKTENEK